MQVYRHPLVNFSRTLSSLDHCQQQQQHAAESPLEVLARQTREALSGKVHGEEGNADDASSAALLQQPTAYDIVSLQLN